ncbi:oligopeptide transport system ATP-binding protein [Oceanobacillus limi]|uniref:Oligopeptide transport system ATP-binding protein n=1 Tax=Oceanobacillus limi TaxID=930131 RepID=A0A1H9YB74_9BACI|nr:oligopeptide/dipeptide ABC transporter ATP-binding protein [Oceanobacillus limi]SES66067.1 oligopeptide transport system ATP-binding protein [Oceanobacillus limi]
MKSDPKNVLLKVAGLKKHFPVQKKGNKKEQQVVKAVDGVSFHVRAGETLGIVGESGSGKSTVAKLIMQLLQPTEGEVVFQDKDIFNQTKKQRKQTQKRIQMVFQDPYASLNPRMTAKQIVTEPLRIHEKMSKEDLDKRALELLEEVGLGKHHLNRYPHQFSGGQRQRLSIARAIALKPNLIVCDEAVSALDVSIQAQILNLLKQLQKNYGIAFIFIAHGLPAVKHISDRIAIMYAGQIVEIADRDVLFTNPKHPYTKALLDAVPPSNPRHRKEKTLVKGEPPSLMSPTRGCPFVSRCPNATEGCHTNAPELLEHEVNHHYACHHPVQAPNNLENIGGRNS